ncbi:hypothetical protein ACWDRX_15605 [Streptomyces nigra]
MPGGHALLVDAFGLRGEQIGGEPPGALDEGVDSSSCRRPSCVSGAR